MKRAGAHEFSLARPFELIPPALPRLFPMAMPAVRRRWAGDRVCHGCSQESAASSCPAFADWRVPSGRSVTRGISRNPVDSGGGEKHCLQLAQEWRQRCVGARQRPDKTDPSVRALSSARRPVPLRRQTLEVWEKVTCSADVDCLSADCVAVLAITTSQTWWCIS